MMEKVIWVVCDNRLDAIEAQRNINYTGSMRAVCILSFDAFKHNVEVKSSPSLIVIDYAMVKKHGEMLNILKSEQKLTGVPIFFMTEEYGDDVIEECYRMGGLVVIHKPFSQPEVTRIERFAWQYEVTKRYEQTLGQQAADIRAAKEIARLNKQLESRNQFLHQVFGRYFSDEVLEVILDKPEGATIGGVREKVTIMMVDLRGFTSMSEEISPEAMTDLLNVYFGRMVEIITGYRGTVIEFLGDGILAVFGEPLKSSTHRGDAIAAAIVMQNSIEMVNEYCKEKDYPLLEMGIGIHCGEAFVGNIGSEKMMRYNVLGKAVNECSRVENCSVGGQVLVSGETVDELDDELTIASDMKVYVKGIKSQMRICDVTGIGGNYNCQLKLQKGDVRYPTAKPVEIRLYRIMDKIISNEWIPSKLFEVSIKSAVVELGVGELSMYSNLRVEAFNDNGQELFKDVYAKVIGVSDNKVTLRFTHINQEFRRFLIEDV